MNVRLYNEMKRHGDLYADICKMDNIYLAYQKAKKGKTLHRNIRIVMNDELSCLTEIQEMLETKTYKTSPYEVRTIYEPKEREIYVLPFFPDRIVHHALMNIVSPFWESMFIHDSYACLEGRGLHVGSQRTMEFVRRNRYCLKCDISKFYPSIDHEILLKIIKRKIKCPDTIWLLEEIIRSVPNGKNAPIGNFTSQWFGNLYLNEVDKFIKQELRIKDYIRYCDDFLLFHDDKKLLGECKNRIEDFCEEKLALHLSKHDLFPVSRGVDFLGYRHFPEYILLRKRTSKKMKRLIKMIWRNYDIFDFQELKQAQSQVASALGWIKHANSYNFRQSTNIEELRVKIDERIHSLQ